MSQVDSSPAGGARRHDDHMPRTIADILGCASPTNTREPDDFYATPPECTEALINAEADRLPLRVWDPCCGAGDISTVLLRHGREVVSTDLIDRGYGPGGVDFLLQTTTLATAIVTNPPFKRAEAFLRHAAELRIDYVAFLHKADWLNAAERGCLIESVWCPARCYLLQWRPDFKNQGASTMNCNWYVFERTSMKARSWTSSLLWRPTNQLQLPLSPGGNTGGGARCSRMCGTGRDAGADKPAADSLGTSLNKSSRSWRRSIPGIAIR